MNRTPRAIRYMIKAQKIPARLVGHTYVIQREHLPLTDEQRQKTEAVWGKVRDVVDRVLPIRDPLPDAVPPVQAAEPASSPEQEKPRFSVRKLDVFQAALGVYATVVQTGRARGAPPGRPAPDASLLEGLKALSAAYYQFEPRRKRDRLEDARERFTQALAELAALRALLPDHAAGLDAAMESLERQVLPAMGGLLRRVDRKK
jgi:hypothetical protein